MPNEADWSKDYGGHFPGSQKVYVEKYGVRVPMREIKLSAGNKPLQVYDTSGPLGLDPKNRCHLPPEKRTRGKTRYDYRPLRKKLPSTE